MLNDNVLMAEDSKLPKYQTQYITIAQSCKLTICPLTDGIVVGGVCCTVAVNTCLHQSEWSIITTVPWIILQLGGKRKSPYTVPQVNE